MRITTAALDALDAQRAEDIAEEARIEAIRNADLDALIADLDDEPYADEYQAPQTAWTTATGPADLWNTSTLTEWEM